jgi:hypothetical protein
MRAFLGSLAALVVLVAGGCASKSAPAKRVSVAGKIVAADGKPIGNLVITFHAQEAANADARPTGHVKADGSFNLENQFLPGRYKVTVVPIPSQHGTAESGGLLTDAPGVNAGGAKTPADRLASYRNSSGSPWEVDVPPEGDAAMTLVVK